MRFALLYGLLIWLPQNLAAQGQLAISEGTFFQSFDNVSLNIDDTELLTDGELIGTNSNIFISSNFAQTNLGGEGNNHFGRLYLYSPNGEFLLVNSIEINDLLELNESSLNLGSADLIFPSEGGYLEGETNEFRVYSKNGGKIIKTTTLNKPQNVSPGNLGFIISSNENLGLTEIYRTHSSTTLPSGEGISKTFELYTDKNPSSPLNISISYFDTEAKNMDYEPQIWMLENTGEWTPVRTSSERNSDTQSNRVSANISEPTLTYTVGPEKVYPVDISSIPTAFTPNGDGTNDTFLIPFIDEDFNGRVTIISRWGDVIYSSDNYYYAPWDGHYKGKLMPTATYYYVVSFGSDQRNEIKGNISIVR